MMKPAVLPRLCYILITEDTDKRAHNRTIDCLLLPELPSFLSHLLEQSTISLVYFRRFDCTLDAMGHQMLLQGFEPTSVNRVISQMNPEWENLTEQLVERLTKRPLYYHKDEDDEDD